MRPEDALTPALLKTTAAHIEALGAMGLRTVGDLLTYLPREHEDLSMMHTLRTAPVDQKCSMRGTISKLRKFRSKTGKNMITATFTDEEGSCADVVWFNQPHLLRMISEGQETVLTGKLSVRGSALQLQAPELERDGGSPLLHSGKLVPVYPQHEIVNTKWLREKMNLVRGAIKNLPETLDQSVIDEERLMTRKEAIEAMHFPSSGEDVIRARFRLAFEEMYVMQTDVLERKAQWQGSRDPGLRLEMNVDLIKSFFASLKFTPTDGQRVAIYEILKDMEQDRPMCRLLEGDVGSGKTLVATAVIANVIRAGGQCALMVPTEVLAKQHANSIAKTLLAFDSHLRASGAGGIRSSGSMPPSTALLTGAMPASEADDVRRKLSSGLIDLVIGTHALIQDSVTFSNLKFVIVDEQHRFGVMQRERLRQKGNPHFLSMTATPIPRTLALTAYGDNDLSVLTEKPGNRKPIDTKVVSPKDRKTVELFIDSQISQGRQVFVICPLIDASENEELSEIKNVKREVERLTEHFPHRRIAHLHGKMSSQDKEEIMRRFKEREADILVSTSVIEVGIDVPNASIIVIEGSERFGLAQLHQFRGRVGRGEHKSHCFLFATAETQARSARLKAMEKHSDGFLLAELDLKIRGPGELYGLRQSGIALMRFQDSLLNPELVVRARKAAERILSAKK